MKRQLKVFVYYNLHKHCWSVKALNGDMKGRVILHTDEVWLKDVEFRVQPAGRARVLREGKKNVHAGVVGTLVDGAGMTEHKDVEFYYNPFRFNRFVIKGRYPNTFVERHTHNTKGVLMKDRKVYHASY